MVFGHLRLTPVHVRRRGRRCTAVALPGDHGLDVNEVLTPVQQLLQPWRRILELPAKEVDDEARDERVQEPAAALLERLLRNGNRIQYRSK